MSRADWSFLEQLLEEGQENSTLIGRVWLVVLFLFRILALGAAAESAWDDEQASFICNTKQPGCEEVCYDKAFPISHFRYFVLQCIFVSTPTIFYFGYVAVRARKEAKHRERERQQQEEDRRKSPRRRSHGGGGGGVSAKLEVIQEKDEEALVAEERKEAKRGGGGGGGAKRGGAVERPKLKGRLLGAYALSIALKLGLEVGFIVGLWLLYGFVVPARYVCQREPCQHKVDCYVSRPTEKTIFTIYIQAIAGVSVLLNILELLNLLQRAITQRLEKHYRDNATWPARGTREIARMPSRLETTSSEGTPAPAYEERAQQYLPSLEGPFAQTQPSWPLDEGVGEAEAVGEGSSADMLPSYLNCISGIRPLATNHISRHQQQQLHHMQAHKHSRRCKHGHHKGGDSKHRHYV